MDPVAELRAIVGDGEVRDAEPADSVDGVRPELVVRPGTVEEVGGVMGVASRRGWSVAPRGGGTKLGLGNPPRALHLVLDLSRMDRVLEHAAGDLVTSVEAGVRLETLQGELAGSRQMLALDPPETGATVGGVIAANASGARRLRFGTARDLLIGVTIVLADGTVAKAGGKVVKNVAGYDLGKLMTGSLGTLGVIVRAVFRLHPLAAARRLVEAEPSSPQEVERTVQRLLHSTLVPSAIQLRWAAGDAPRLGVLFEGVEPSVVAQAAAAASLVGAGAQVRDDEDDVAARWRDLTLTAQAGGGTELKVTCLPNDLGRVLETVRTEVERHGGDWRLTGMAGSGVLHVRLGDADPDGVAATIRELRGAVGPGHVVVLGAPLEVKRQIDVWGPVGDGVELMRRVKARFDPDHLLNPGRFVGGI